MLRLEEYQVKCYGSALPEESVEVLGRMEVSPEVACKLLRWVAEYAERCGYTLSEIAEYGEG